MVVDEPISGNESDIDRETRTKEKEYEKLEKEVEQLTIIIHDLKRNWWSSRGFKISMTLAMVTGVVSIIAALFIGYLESNKDKEIYSSFIYSIGITKTPREKMLEDLSRITSELKDSRDEIFDEDLQ